MYRAFRCLKTAPRSNTTTGGVRFRSPFLQNLFVNFFITSHAWSVFCARMDQIRLCIFLKNVNKIITNKIKTLQILVQSKCCFAPRPQCVRQTTTRSSHHRFVQSHQTGCIGRWTNPCRCHTRASCTTGPAHAPY